MTTDDKDKLDNKKVACCCQAFDPTKWDEKEFTWDNKPFVHEWTWCLWYMPLNFGGALARAQRKIDAATADESDIVLSDMVSPWYTNIFAASSKNDVPNAQMVHLSGTFVTKVFEGPYQNFGQWIAAMQQYVQTTRGLDNVNPASAMYVQYGTCPKCAQTMGKNYVVLWVKVA